MIKSYIKIAIRNMVRNRTSTLINILGLATGIACFVMICLYVLDELSYDRYNSKSERIFRLVNIYNSGGVGEESSSCPFPVAPTLELEYGGIIEKTVRIFNFQTSTVLIRYKENCFNEKRFFYADSTVFEIFDWEFIKGNPKTALNEPYSIVLTQSAAKKYFGDEDPVNKILNIEESIKMKVTAIIKDPPSQSHFTFDFLSSMGSVRNIYGGSLPNTWVWNPCWTYLLLKEGHTPEEINDVFPEFVNKYYYDAERENISGYLQPLTDIHLKSDLDYEIEPNSNILYIYILVSIAVFLLLIACINFMNLTTATSAVRASEIGIKKVHGAKRIQLITQFLTEAVFTSCLSLVLALAIVELALPFFNDFAGKTIKPDFIFNLPLLTGLLLLGLLTGIISGIYPAFYLSAFNTVTILKGKFSPGVRSIIARKGLVILQFTISIALTICTLTAYKQLTYLKSADLGFKKDEILILPVAHSPVVVKFDEMKEELLQHSNIKQITGMDYVIGTDHNTHEFRPEGYPDSSWQFYPTLVVRDDFVETFDINVVAGRAYNKKNKTDAVDGLMINEAMVKHLGWKSNEEALGKKFNSLQGKEKVIGIFNNFHTKSLQESPGPFILNIKEVTWEINSFTKYMAIRISGGDNKDILDFIETKWKTFAPNRPFEYFFLKNRLDKMYDGEDKLGKLAGVISVIIILIAGIGLFGLISYLTEQKTKEIGIRKVMGARAGTIIRLLTREFFWLIVSATVLAWVLAWFAINQWLENFAVRTEIDYRLFVISGVSALLLAIAIIAIRGLKAANKNPAVTLKHE